MRRILLGCAACAVLLGIAPVARSQALPEPGTYFMQEPPAGKLQTDAVIYVDDGTCPTGEIKELTGGNARGMERKRQCITLSASGLAAAQEAPKFLSQQEVQQALTGKVLLFNRLSDGKAVRWDIRSGANVFANLAGRTYSGGSGGGFPGTWETKEDGALCIKWRDSSEHCHYFVWVGDKLKLTSERTVVSAVGAATITFEK
jgi:hypothetical protein